MAQLDDAQAHAVGPQVIPDLIYAGTLDDEGFLSWSGSEADEMWPAFVDSDRMTRRFPPGGREKAVSDLARELNVGSFETSVSEADASWRADAQAPLSVRMARRQALSPPPTPGSGLAGADDPLPFGGLWGPPTRTHARAPVAEVQLLRHDPARLDSTKIRLRSRPNSFALPGAGNEDEVIDDGDVGEEGKVWMSDGDSDTSIDWASLGVTQAQVTNDSGRLTLGSPRLKLRGLPTSTPQFHREDKSARKRCRQCWASAEPRSTHRIDDEDDNVRLPKWHSCDAVAGQRRRDELAARRAQPEEAIAWSFSGDLPCDSHAATATTVAERQHGVRLRSWMRAASGAATSIANAVRRRRPPSARVMAFDGVVVDLLREPVADRV